MTAQSHEQTEEEIGIAITLLVSVSACTESELFTDWHQELQGSIHSLISTTRLLQKQTAIDKIGGLG